MIIDKNPAEAFDEANEREGAVVLDVRTPFEVSYVGAPAMENWLNVSLTLFPPTQADPDFLNKVVAAGLEKDQPIYCLCKLGGRSTAAAKALLNDGYTEVYNIAGGFDGDQNEQGQRRCINGWVADGLPWHQA